MNVSRTGCLVVADTKEPPSMKTKKIFGRVLNSWSQKSLVQDTFQDPEAQNVAFPENYLKSSVIF
jgi:hypothetical protein